MFRILLSALCLLPFFAQAHTPTDSIVFTATSIVAELDPNSNNYCFTLKGNANDTPWKMQIDYYADSEFGTFGDTEFRLPKAGGSSTNWIRKDDGTYKTYYGYSLTATVGLNAGVTVIDLEGLYRENKAGQDTIWHAVKVHAEMEPLTPKATHQLDLGQVAIVPNTFLDYLIMEAANDDYTLAFGLSGLKQLPAGTFYRTEMIRPDLVARATGDTIAPLYAQLEVRDSTVVGLHQLTLDLYDTDTVLYRIAMHTDTITIRDTIDVACKSAEIADYSNMFNMLQVTGLTPDYQVAFAIKPGIFVNAMTEIPNDSVDLSYTQLYRRADNTLIRVQQATGRFAALADTIFANLVGTDNILYRVCFPLVNNALPEATDTTYIECGSNVGRLDYTHGAGLLGLVIGNDDADVHITVNNELQMKGYFAPDAFIYNEPKAYVTTYTENDGVIRFSDIQAAEMQMDSIGNMVDIQLKVVTITSRMYWFHAQLQPTRALTDNEVEYTINNAATDDGMMVAFRMAKQGDNATYRLQFQRSDEWTESGEMSGDNYEIWDFGFSQDQIDGISGTYGYAAGTLNDDNYHFVMEHGTEILLQPMAGTLTITAGEAVTIPASVLGFEYHTHLYTVEARLVAENNHIYHITGQNFLLCVDYNTSTYLEFTEQQISALNDVLMEQGLKARKVMRNGIILIEKGEKKFTAEGTSYRQ